jgi:hypothetical protein
VTRGTISTGRGPTSTGRGASVGGESGGGGGGGGGGSANYIYVTETDLQNANTTAFSGQYNDLINGTGRSAAVADATSFQHVTDDNGNNQFEGDTNNRHDYNAALDMSEKARDSALAYWFRDANGEGNADAYARTAVDSIYEWFLDDTDYMEPIADVPGDPGTIRVDIWLPSFFYAAALVAGHPRWGTYDGDTPWKGGSVAGAEEAFAEWIRDYMYSGNYGGGESHRDELDDGFVWKNNRNGFWCNTELAGAVYLGRDSDVQTMKDFYKVQALQPSEGQRHWTTWDDYTVSNSEAFPEAEMDRDDDYQYCSYHELGLAYCCRVVEAYDGTDLWNFTAPNDPTNNATLKRGLNWSTLQAGTKDRDNWNDPTNQNGTQGSNGTPFPTSDVEQGATLYELGYTQWGDSAYLDVVQNADGISRPHWDSRILGPIAVTHATP